MAGPIRVHWLWAFLDAPAERAERSWSFWESITRSRLSARRGADGEFATLDYGEDGEHQRPTLYTGRAVELAEVGLQPLRRFEGWRA